MRPWYTPILLLLALFVLAGCEDGVPHDLPGFGGGPVGGDQDAILANFQGVWEGRYGGSPPGDPEQWVTTFTGIMHNGRMVLFESNGQIWDAEYTVLNAGSVRMGDVHVFGPNGVRLTRLVITGALRGTNFMDLSMDLGTGVGIVQIELNRDPNWESGSALSRLAGVWSSGGTGANAVSLAVNDVGGQAVFDGADGRDCKYNGVIELIDGSRNLYRINDFVVTDGVPGACDVIINVITEETDQAGPIVTPTPHPFAFDQYTGFATLVPDQDTLLMVVTYKDEQRAVRFRLARN